MTDMRHLVAPIVGVAVVAVLGIGTHSMAATSQGPSSSSATSQEPDKEKPEAPESDNPGGRSAHASQMVAIAQAHREGMKQWQRCTAAARDSKSSTPKCSKPLPPGWVKHPNKHTGERAPGHGKADEAHGD
jgi:hypothetical protein